MKPQIQQFVRMLTADKKKLSLMLGLVAVGLLLWGRLLLKEVPRTATAGTEAELSAADGEEAVRPRAPKATIKMTHAGALGRDIFNLDAKAFPRLVETPAEDPKAEKSAPKRADVTDVAGAVRKAAEGLKLQTTMVGDNPRAMINGKLLKPGERIEGFELLEVSGRQAVLLKDGVVIRLGL